MPGDTIVGGIIVIEHTDDHTASTPTWDKVGKTTDTVEIEPNPETADRRHHGSRQLDKRNTSEAWEISFSASILTGSAQLETLDLIDTSTYEYQAYADSDETSNTADALRVTVYENKSDEQSDTPKWQVATDDYLLNVDSSEVDVEDFATREFVIHSRTRPVDIEAGGSL